MKKYEFVCLCEELAILPAVALESELVRDALARRDDERVRELLENIF